VRHAWRDSLPGEIFFGQAAPVAVTREAWENRWSVNRRRPRTSDSVTRTYSWRLHSPRLRNISYVSVLYSIVARIICGRPGRACR
jgi:hypothetical protein